MRIPAAMVIRFTVNDEQDARGILETFQASVAARHLEGTEAWMCVAGDLDDLNDTLAELGWPDPNRKVRTPEEMSYDFIHRKT